MSDMNLDSLLDASLDDLADLPEFLVFPAGAYRVVIGFEKKAINNHPAIEIKMKNMEVVELGDAAATPPEVGAESSVAYMMDNEFGQGNFKKVMKPLGEHFGVGKLGEIMEQAQGLEVVAVVKTRMNKDKTQTYQDIVSLSPL